MLALGFPLFIQLHSWKSLQLHSRLHSLHHRRISTASRAPTMSCLLPLDPQTSPMDRQPCRVAVIGAGAAGLVAARELQREGHSVVVYEQSDRLGGVWAFSPEVEDDPLGLRPDRKPVHSSMYESLRTNLPREIMGYLDFPFLPKEGRDGRRYPGHEEVLLYLQDFVEHFDLFRLIRFGRTVKRVGIHRFILKDGSSSLLNGNGIGSLGPTLDRISGEFSSKDSKLEIRASERLQWSVSTESEEKKSAIDSFEEEVFDAVVVCNGHYFQPKIAVIPGIERWPGKQLHSHNYRVPHPFADQVVVVIGNASSGVDISREISNVAKEVHMAGRTWESSVDMSHPVGSCKNIWLHLMVDSAHEDGTVKFQDGASVVADVILHCTGYAFSFPFLDTQGIVTIDNDRVGPLYQHVFPPLLAPSLSFVGLPFKVVPFPLMELQSKWIALSLSRKVHLPSRRDMMAAVEDFYASIEAKGWPKEKTHNLGPYQFEYDDWLVEQCGCDPLELWRKEIYMISSKRKRTNPENYRDTWVDQDLHDIAMEDLFKLGKSIQYI